MSSRGKVIFILKLILFPLLLRAQETPVKWNYSVKKFDDTAYVVIIKSTIQKGWHLYSQHQPDGAIALPISIKFSANPLVKIVGSVKEAGKLKKFEDTSTGIVAFEYEQEVSFIQQIVLKVAVRTSTIATIRYQVCSDEKCLPATTVKLGVSIP
jgi:hypothetical protein